MSYTLGELKRIFREVSTSKNQSRPVVFQCPNPQCHQYSAVTAVTFNEDPVQDAATGARHVTGIVLLESHPTP